MNWLRRFMYGRYGVDHLTVAGLILYILIDIIAGLLGLHWLRYLSVVIIVLAAYRVLSKNTYARYGENQKFLSVYNPAKSWVISRFNMLKSLRTHKFFRCPSCSQRLRVPRGKGRISITCTKCRTSFIGKS